MPAILLNEGVEQYSECIEQMTLFPKASTSRLQSSVLKVLTNEFVAAFSISSKDNESLPVFIIEAESSSKFLAKVAVSPLKSTFMPFDNRTKNRSKATTNSPLATRTFDNGIFPSDSLFAATLISLKAKDRPFHPSLADAQQEHQPPYHLQRALLRPQQQEVVQDF
jgi:hypothetical protein